jgi:hypothetical protein
MTIVVTAAAAVVAVIAVVVAVVAGKTPTTDFRSLGKDAAVSSDVSGVLVNSFLSPYGNSYLIMYGQFSL